jgi:hypothetical protein
MNLIIHNWLIVTSVYFYLKEKNTKCTLPADPGFCRGHVERYFYDSQSRACKTFKWGGCLGNANNFHTEQDCMSVCHQQVEPVTFGGKLK